MHLPDRRLDVKYEMNEKAKSTPMPVAQPNWAIAHANQSTPDPITAVVICALAVKVVLPGADP